MRQVNSLVEPIRMLNTKQRLFLPSFAVWTHMGQWNLKHYVELTKTIPVPLKDIARNTTVRFVQHTIGKWIFIYLASSSCVKWNVFLERIYVSFHHCPVLIILSSFLLVMAQPETQEMALFQNIYIFFHQGLQDQPSLKPQSHWRQREVRVLSRIGPISAYDVDTHLLE